MCLSIYLPIHVPYQRHLSTSVRPVRIYLHNTTHRALWNPIYLSPASQLNPIQFILLISNHPLSILRSSPPSLPPQPPPAPCPFLPHPNSATHPPSAAPIHPIPSSHHASPHPIPSITPSQRCSRPEPVRPDRLVLNASPRLLPLSHPIASTHRIGVPIQPSLASLAHPHPVTGTEGRYVPSPSASPSASYPIFAPRRSASRRVARCVRACAPLGSAQDTEEEGIPPR